MEEYDQLSNQISLLNNSFERIRLQLVNYKDYLEGLNKEMREVQDLELKEDIDLLTPPDSAHSSPELGGINTRDGGVGHSLDIYFTQLDIMMEQLNQLNYAQQKHDTQLKSIKQQQESIESKVHQCLNQNSAITLQQSISYQNTINQAKSANLTAKKKRRWSFSSSKKSKKFNWWGITHQPIPHYYSGSRDNEEIEDWIQQIKKYINYIEVKEEKSAIKIASSFLKSEALDWWESYHFSNNGELPKTLESFFTDLKATFNPLFKFELKRDKSIIDYIFKFENLIQSRVNFSNLSEFQKIESFLKGLDNPKIVDWIQSKSPKTLNQVIALALELDQLSAQSKPDDSPGSKSERKKSIRKNDALKCEYCHKKGHIQLHCFLKQMGQLSINK